MTWSSTDTITFTAQCSFLPQHTWRNTDPETYRTLSTRVWDGYLGFLPSCQQSDNLSLLKQNSLDCITVGNAFTQYRFYFTHINLFDVTWPTDPSTFRGLCQVNENGSTDRFSRVEIICIVNLSFYKKNVPSRQSGTGLATTKTRIEPLIRS